MKAIVCHQAVRTFRVSNAGFEMPKGPSLSKNSTEKVNEPFYYLLLLEHLFLHGIKKINRTADLLIGFSQLEMIFFLSLIC